MAYEMLTGQPPFHGRPPHAVLSAHLHGTAAAARDGGARRAAGARRTRDEVPGEDPADRPQTADELVRALERIDLSGDWRAPARQAAASGKSRRPTAIAAVVVIVIAAAGWLLWQRFRPRGPAPDQNMVAVVPFRVATADPALHYLREGMLDLLAAKLTGEGGMRATDPRQLLDAWRRAGGSESVELPRDDALAFARRLGAGRLLLGDVVGTPNRIVLTASLLGSVPRRLHREAQRRRAARQPCVAGRPPRIPAAHGDLR